MAAWLEALAAAERDGRAAVLVTVLAAKGSTPREAGAKMVVSAGGLAGTIGGGNLEFQCAAVARGLLADGGSAVVTRDFPLGPALGQCCGGHVTVLFEVVRPPALHVALFGAGHVGSALVRLLGELPCRVSWVDPRPGVLPAVVPGNVSVSSVVSVAAVPAGSVVLVMTHDHGLDFEIVAAALARDDLAFVGVIGSATKRARFVSRLARVGVPAERLVCPIGVAGIAGKEPAVVALSVAAQVMALRDGGGGGALSAGALAAASGVTAAAAGGMAAWPGVMAAPFRARAVPAKVMAAPADAMAAPPNVMAGPDPAACDSDPPLPATQRSLAVPYPARSCADCTCSAVEDR
jgi:xanthine dehydrogenase accessory factor